MKNMESFSPRERRFGDATQLIEALSTQIVLSLQAGLSSGRAASLVVPGGRSPIALFERLSTASLDWSNVWITLTDERWVASADESSNERLVRQHLLRQAAARAHFVGLKNNAAEASAGAVAAWTALAEMPRPFDFALLGMGDDGHIASLFPESAALHTGLDLAQRPGRVAMQAPVAPLSRLSLNLRALLDARQIAVLALGESKWTTYQRARTRGPVEQMPVRALTGQQNVPVEFYWSP